MILSSPLMNRQSKRIGGSNRGFILMRRVPGIKMLRRRQNERKNGKRKAVGGTGSRSIHHGGIR